MLEEVTTVESRQDVAMTLVKIYLGQGLVVPFLDYLNTREVNHTSKTKRKSANFKPFLKVLISCPPSCKYLNLLRIYVYLCS